MCIYKLEGEEKLTFEMLVTMDGNDSLKHVSQHDAALDITGEGQEQHCIRESKEQLDERDVEGDYYLPYERVKHWANKLPSQDLLPSNPKNEDEGKENPCAGCWMNMVNEVTARMWGIFDETGIFLALCCHGFVLVITNMIQSSEL